MERKLPHMHLSKSEKKNSSSQNPVVMIQIPERFSATLLSSLAVLPKDKRRAEYNLLAEQKLVISMKVGDREYYLTHHNWSPLLFRNQQQTLHH